MAFAEGVPQARATRYNAWIRGILWAAVVASFLIHARHLGHEALTYWDESFHAVVAENLLAHPLMPTLIDHPYLPDSGSWTSTRIWLHKPILPLWQVAVAFWFFGVTTFALRLPSAIFAAGATLLTYSIGRELFDRRVGAIAAVLQAFSPTVTSLVQGYLFADHIDMALLFWVEAGMYALVRGIKSGARRYFVLAGAAQGLAYLSKSHLAGIITLVALAAWWIGRRRTHEGWSQRLRPTDLAMLLGATVVVAAPWTLYCLTHYYEPFVAEQRSIFHHVTGNVEGRSAPWHQVVFGYLVGLCGASYLPVMIALSWSAWTAIRRADARLAIGCAWSAGVLVPLSIAETKTPSGALLALPALLILAAHFVVDAVRLRDWRLAAWVGGGVLAVFRPASAAVWPFPDVDSRAWLAWQAVGLAAFIAFVHLAIRWRRVQWPARVTTTGSGSGMPAVLALATIGIVVWLDARASWAVTAINDRRRAFADVARFAREALPANAVLLVEEESLAEDGTVNVGGALGDDMQLMFRSNRTSYNVTRQDFDAVSRMVYEHGGAPYIVSFRTLPLPVVFRSDRDRRIVHVWTPAS